GYPSALFNLRSSLSRICCARIQSRGSSLPLNAAYRTVHLRLAMSWGPSSHLTGPLKPATFSGFGYLSLPCLEWVVDGMGFLLYLGSVLFAGGISHLR